MSTIETILSRMMHEPDFAEAVFSDVESALAEYELSTAELIQIKSISHSKFKATSIEERKSFASVATARGGGFFQFRDEGG